MDWEDPYRLASVYSISWEHSALWWVPKEPYDLGFLPTPEVSHGPIASDGGEMTV